MWEFGFVNSTMQTIWKNRRKIIGAFEKNGPKIKGFRKPKRSDVDDFSKKEVTTCQ